MAKMITRVVECVAIDDEINYLIERWEETDWFLRGTPIFLNNGYCLLVFETEAVYEEESAEITDDIPEDVE